MQCQFYILTKFSLLSIPYPLLFLDQTLVRFLYSQQALKLWTAPDGHTKYVPSPTYPGNQGRQGDAFPGKLLWSCHLFILPWFLTFPLKVSAKLCLLFPLKETLFFLFNFEMLADFWDWNILPFLFEKSLLI